MNSDILPKGWRKVRLSEVARLQTGLALGKSNVVDPVKLPYLRVANVQDGYFDLGTIKEVEIARSEVPRYSLREGDVLFTEGGDADKLGRGAVWSGEVQDCLHQNHVFAVRVEPTLLLPAFLAAYSASTQGKAYFLGCSKQSTNLASINSSQLKAMPLPLPPLPEQREIVAVLAAWDGAIKVSEKLLAAKRRRKAALMQQLLTGRVRFRRFAQTAETISMPYGTLPADWQYRRIGEIANEVSERNKSGAALQVLSCTKYDGLVDSLAYFGRQIFSDDLAAYKVVRRGQFAYATNHIEEGSIGYQNLADAAVISPMYTVFRTNDHVDDGFLYKVLKSSLYLHVYQVNTSASVDRRGSLRWSEFSHIRVPVPSLAEQRAIAEVLDAQQKEIDLLNRKLEALRRQKKGLMQQLLTGRVRVGVAPTDQKAKP